MASRSALLSARSRIALPSPHLCSSSSNLSAWLRPAPTGVASTEGRRQQAARRSKRTLPEADQQRLDAVAARIDDDEDDVAMAG